MQRPLKCRRTNNGASAGFAICWLAKKTIPLSSFKAHLAIDVRCESSLAPKYSTDLAWPIAIKTQFCLRLVYGGNFERVNHLRYRPRFSNLKAHFQIIIEKDCYILWGDYSTEWKSRLPKINFENTRTHTHRSKFNVVNTTSNEVLIY